MDNLMKFYRYDTYRYAMSGYDNEFVCFSEPTVKLTEYNMHKETPKGYWIGYGNGQYESGQKWNLKSNSIWVSKTSKKRFAYPTKEEAIHGFIARTQRRANILSSQLYVCNTALNLAKKLQETLTTVKHG
jgi:hypothetical protein